MVDTVPGTQNEAVRNVADGKETFVPKVSMDGGGSTSDTAWNGTDADASLVSIAKAIYAQNAQMIGLLEDIKTNTTA